MRPIRLSILGLNSYIEEQVIDFDKLCSKGLFGIFGPTGCGKSTILDAITISLYGAAGMARETKDFINTEVDKAVLKYTFSLGSENNKKTYEVSRSFKNSKTGINNDMAKVVVKDHFEEIIDIYDKPKDVNQFIEELLGLKAEDFMRSVVLPQGKFSEFLKLKDSDRRKMIERLLNLQEFGVKLSEKIKRERDALKSRLEYLEGSIKALSPEELESIDSLDNSLNLLKDENDKLVLKLNEKRSVLDVRKLIYIKTNELGKLEADLNKLMELSAEINSLREKVYRGKEAQKIEGTYKELDVEKQALAKLDNQLIDIKNRYDETKLRLDDSKIRFENAVVKKDRDLPDLVEKKARLESVLILHAENKENQKLIEGYRSEYKSMKLGFDETEKTLSEVSEVISTAGQRIKALDDEKVKFNVSRELKDFAYDMKGKNQAKSEEEAKIKKVTEDIQKNLHEKDQLSAKIDSMKADLSILEGNLTAISKEFDGLSIKRDELNDILLEHKSIELKNTMDAQSYELKLKEKKDKIDEVHRLTDKRETLIKDIDLAKSVIVELESKLDEARKASEKNRINMALNQLSHKIEDGKACPLCGSLDHPSVYVHTDELEAENTDSSVLNEQISIQNEKYIGLSKDLQITDNELLKLNSEISQLSVYSDEGLEILKIDLNKLGESITFNTRKLNKAIEDLSKLRTTKPDIELKVTETREEYRKITSNIELVIHKLETAKTDKLSSELKAKDLDAYIREGLIKVGYDDLSTLLIDIESKENKLLLIDKEQKELRDKVDESLSKSDILTKEKEKLSQKLTELSEKGIAMSGVIEKNNKKIKDVTSGDPTIELNEVEASIKEINRVYEEVQSEVKVNQEKFEQIDKEKVQFESNCSITKERTLLLGKRLDESISSSIFIDIQDFKTGLISDQELAALEQNVNDHDDKVKEFKAQIGRLSEELGEDRCTEEEFKAHGLELAEIEELSKEKSKEFNILSTKLEHLKENRKKLEGALKEKRELSDRLGLVMEISKMIQGNKFVEFVSMNHLKYIAIDASNRLMDITSGRYSLEMDYSGGFIICDNYNGGVKRSCQTLSGGETFMTSLSLALALSTHIQLKGSTALEFFILDEGFGTLDSDLLDTVMTSLEKLRSKNISVGVISHVDELKNRVPVKLNVEPATAGLNGTKVKIEVS